MSSRRVAEYGSADTAAPALIVLVGKISCVWLNVCICTSGISLPAYAVTMSPISEVDGRENGRDVVTDSLLDASQRI